MTGRRFFMTGTDTEVGKTFVSSAILREVASRVPSRVGIKPVAAGCTFVDGELRNEDAIELMAAAECSLEYREINPVALEPAIAPHIALGAANRVADVKSLAGHCRRVAAPFEFALIEGAGGWYVPLNDEETLADLCVALEADAILVVAMRLGCLNHALLTAEAINRAGVKLAGWVANVPQPDSMACLDENIISLRHRLRAPCLGEIPPLRAGPIAAGQYLNLDPLFD